MHQKLVTQALKKIKKKEEGKLDIPVSDTQASELLSTILSEDYKTPLSDRRLRDIHNGLIKIKKPQVLLSLCHFLEYKNYEDFKAKNETEVPPVIFDMGNSDQSEVIEDSPDPPNNFLIKTKCFVKKNKVHITILFISLCIGIAFYASTKQRWMVWKEDHYEEVPFNTKKYKLGQLKLYKEERIKHFKKIKGTCEYHFYDEAGEPAIWYGRNNTGELELFTSIGLHPETGKTLKHITPYMIDKYICN